jgi:hypothetical protein
MPASRQRAPVHNSPAANLRAPGIYSERQQH